VRTSAPRPSYLPHRSRNSFSITCRCRTKPYEDMFLGDQPIVTLRTSASS
jgi:hypothetical protein